MHLYIGGVYQGKRACAARRFALNDSDFFTCSADSAKLDLRARGIDRLEEYVLACVRAGLDPRAVFLRDPAAWAESVICCADIFCGVVPLEAEERAWREETGRLCAFLSEKAESVTRVWCGLEQRLK